MMSSECLNYSWLIFIIRKSNYRSWHLNFFILFAFGLTGIDKPAFDFFTAQKEVFNKTQKLKLLSDAKSMSIDELMNYPKNNLDDILTPSLPYATSQYCKYYSRYTRV